MIETILMVFFLSISVSVFAQATPVEYVEARMQESDGLAREASDFEDRFYQTPWAGAFRDQLVLRDLSRLRPARTITLLLGKADTYRYTRYTEEAAAALVKVLIDLGYTILYDRDSQLGFVMEQVEVPQGRAVALKGFYPTLGGGSNGHKRLVIENSELRAEAFAFASLVIASEDSLEVKNIKRAGIKIVKWEDIKWRGLPNLRKVPPQIWRPYTDSKSEMDFFSTFSDAERAEVIRYADQRERVSEQCANSLR